MVIGSHNAWTFLRPRKWWMRLLAFTARCQHYNIYEQHLIFHSRCFDLRVRFDGDRFVVAHGIIEYEITKDDILDDLRWFSVLSTKDEPIYIRVINEIRSYRKYNADEVERFAAFCKEIEECFPTLVFFCGMNLLPEPSVDYDFGNTVTCEELYASVRKPRIIDDWWPWWYARFHNKKNIAKGTDRDVLLIDFVNIGQKVWW